MFFFSSRRRHTSFSRDWSSDVCSSDLKAGIHLDSTSTYSFSLMNFPDWNMQSSDAVLNENYWSWPTDKTVTLILEPYKNIPEEYRQHRQSLLPSWQQGLDSRSK